MMNSKIVMFARGWLMVTLMAMSTLLIADDQGVQNAEQLSELMTEKMVDELSLTQGQGDQAYQVNRQFVEQMQLLRKSSQGLRIAQLQALREVVNERNEAMRQIMTNEQFNEYIEMTKQQKEELRALMKARRKPATGL
ncbi:MAG: DUF4890 domain-containing protein [Chromatiales bacterium]|nr:DUF4890 domain-containing protein [Chromatiales bacterium]